MYGLKGNEYELVQKYLEDDFFIYDLDKKHRCTKIKRLMLLSHDFVMNDGSGAGGVLLEKNSELQIGGLKDSDEHNRNQDLVIFHETSAICTHIDNNFWIFPFKLPRTKSGIRKEK